MRRLGSGGTVWKGRFRSLKDDLLNTDLIPESRERRLLEGQVITTNLVEIGSSKVGANSQADAQGRFGGYSLSHA